MIAYDAGRSFGMPVLEPKRTATCGSLRRDESPGLRNPRRPMLMIERRIWNVSDCAHPCSTTYVHSPAVVPSDGTPGSRPFAGSSRVFSRRGHYWFAEMLWGSNCVGAGRAGLEHPAAKWREDDRAPPGSDTRGAGSCTDYRERESRLLTFENGRSCGSPSRGDLGRTQP